MTLDLQAVAGRYARRRANLVKAEADVPALTALLDDGDELLRRVAEDDAIFAYLFRELPFPVRHRWGGDLTEFTEGMRFAAAPTPSTEPRNG